MSKLFKKSGIAALAFIGALMFGSSAEAAFGYKIDAGTVDDVTTTACTTGINQAVTGFGNGVSMDQVWQLEREVGSPGSGAWEVVLKDVFPTVNGSAAVGGPTQVINYTSPTVACYRLRMFMDNAGTAQIQLVTNRDGVTAFPGAASYTRWFDDFLHGTIPITTTHDGNTPSYVVFIGAGNGAAVSVIEGEGEGAITFTTGDGGSDDADLSVGSFGLITNGALVSDGLMVVEFRASMSQITDTRVNLGLADRINAATEEEPFQINTNVVTEGAVASFTNAIAFVFDNDSYDAGTDQWNAVSMNANTLGNASDEYDLLTAPVVDTYRVYRIEITADGHAFWYVDGILRGVEPLAVATTAVLIPHWTAGTPDDGTGTANKLYIDYLDFWVARPNTVS